MKRGRRLLLIVFLLGIILVAILEGAHLYLASQHGAALVAGRLQKVYGGPVRVGGVDVHLGNLTLHDLQLFEEGGSSAGQAWLSVANVHADVSVWDLLRGRVEPRLLTLDNAEAALRFDKDGHLLTRLPEPQGEAAALPAIHLEHSRLTLSQEGRPDLVLHDLTADIRSEGPRLSLTGTVAEALGAEWQVNGNLDRSNGAGSLTLATRIAHVTPEVLRGLPFVPESVWQQVQAEGDTPVELTLRLDPAGDTVHYRVALHPEAARIQIAAIDLDTQQTRGKVVIEDDVVRLTDVRGRAAGGTIHLNGTLDFSAPTDRLQFAIDVQDLGVSQLPPTWSLPPQLQGRLSGHALLQILIDEHGRVQTSGEGEAVVNEARVAGFPAEPIRLKLAPAANGFQFTSLDPLAKMAAPDSARAASVPRGSSAVALLLVLLQQPAPKPPPAPPTYLEANLTLKDVDLAQLVQRLELKLPMTVAGRASLQLQMAMPMRSPNDLKTYRFRGTVQSPRLVLADLVLEQVRARVSYANGVLDLEELSGQVPASPRPGAFAGKASWQLIPQGSFQANLMLRDIPLTRALSVVPGIGEQLKGEFSGSVELRAPGANLAEIESWDATGLVKIRRLGFAGLKLDDIEAALRLQRGMLAVQDVRAVLYEGQVSGSALVPVRVRAGGRLDLTVQKVNLGALAPDFPAVPFQVEGVASGTLHATLRTTEPEGNLNVAATIGLQSARLRIQGIPTQKLSGTVNYRREGVDYNLKGETLGGSFELKGSLPLTEAKAAPPAGGSLEVHGAQLTEVWRRFGLLQTLRPLRGSIDLVIRFRHAPIDAAPVGEGRLVISTVRWRGRLLTPSIQARVDLTREELRFRDITSTISGGAMRGQVALGLQSGRRSWLSLGVGPVPAEALLEAWPELSGHIQGQAMLSLRGEALGVDRPWTGSGQLTLAQGRVFSVEVAEARLPFTWRWVPESSQGRGQLDVTEGTAGIAHGRVQVRAGLNWGERIDLRGQLRFFDADLRELAHLGAEFGPPGSGRLTGRLDFAGTDVRSINDLTATLEATLRQTQALQLPVLSALTPFLPTMSSALAFQTGSVRAVLSRGVIRIQSLALQGNLVQLFVQGTVTVQGALNLEVIVNIGRLNADSPWLRLLGVRLPASGAAPLALLQQATNFLSARVVSLHVEGTIRNPSVRVQVLPLLTEDAFRFFVGRLAPVAPEFMGGPVLAPFRSLR